MINQEILLITVYGVVGVVFAIIVLSLALKNRGKILVEVPIPGLPAREAWKKPEFDGETTRVTMRAKSDNTAEWAPTFDTTCLIPKKGLFGRRYDKIIVKPDAPAAVSWKPSGIEQPELTQKEVTEYAKKKVFERRYGTDPHQVNSSIVYLLIGVVIIIQVVTLLVSSGKIRF